MELLKELTQAFGVSGRERQVRDIIRREIAPYADEIAVDAMGNLIALKKGSGGPNAKRIMLAAHMDEIGLQVTKIEADGRIRVHRIGWVWAAAAYNNTVVFQNGILGVVGCQGSIEDAKNDVGKLYIDIGCTSKEETQKHVNVGDYCGFVGPFRELQNGRLCAKSFDNRVGCYIMIEALKKNDGARINDVYYVFTVQEEIGCRGSAASAQRIKPDIGISLDVSPDHAYPSDLDGGNAVGAGVGVKLGDPSAVQDEQLVEMMLACCRENGIPHQRDVMDRGGTDSSGINKAHYGIRVCGISIVDRYPHSQNSVVARDDIKAAIRLTDAFTALEFVFEE
ncbi:MAG: M42 family metallopeptidase [Christensenellales bacterium]|jgi:putative aminopeptidase FrvX